MTYEPRAAWKFSIHGGHSGQFCAHALGALRETLDAASTAGCSLYGVSEHINRTDAALLYPEEVAAGMDAETLARDFERYKHEVTRLAIELKPTMQVLRGFESECAPAATYVEATLLARAARLPDGTAAFDYLVGSVHHVENIPIDGSPEELQAAAERAGGPEALATAYYRAVAAMAHALRPDVAAHLDLIKKNWSAAGFPDVLMSPRVWRAIDDALEAVRASGSILDLNLAGWRKGLGEPYPSAGIVRAAHAMGIPFAFGDDSHNPSQVLQGIEMGRDFLIRCGVSTVTRLERDGPIGSGRTIRREVSL